MLKKIKKDEWAIVLDFLTKGHSGMDRAQPVAYVIGEEYFSLLEVILRDGATLDVQERVYIGDGKRDKVKYIRGRIELRDLTVAARGELENVIRNIVEGKPERFVNFFNKSGQITMRLHQLELLPGVGRKHLWDIIDQRKEKPFESFEDIKKRVPLLSDPVKIIIRRIMEELEEKDKYNLFVMRIEKGQKKKGFEDSL